VTRGPIPVTTPVDGYVLRSELGVNVRDHGATGDGITDDSAAFTAANAAAVADGRSVYIPGGDYVVEGLAPTTSWHGEGTLLHKTGSALVMLSIPNGANDVTIDGLTLDGLNHATQQLILVRGLRQTIQNCHFRNSTGVNGIGVHVYGDTETRRILITGCTFENIEGYGIRMHGLTVDVMSDVIISENRLLDCATIDDLGEPAGHAIGIAGYGKRVQVIGNNVTWTNSGTVGGSGIEGYTKEIEDFQIIGNFVKNARHHGSHVGGTRLKIVGNTYINTNLRAIMISADPNSGPTPKTHFLIADNMIHAPLDTTNGEGILVYNASDGAITGNTIIDAGTNGINVQGGAGYGATNCEDITIAGNTIRWNTPATVGNGIRLMNIKRLAVTGNVIRDHYAAGIVVQEDADGVVEDVTIAANVVTGGLWGIRSSAGDFNRVAITGNVANGAATASFAVQDKTDVMLSGNVSGGSRTIASAAGLNLPEEHDLVVVTGTTTVTTVVAQWAGRVVTLKFDGALTFTDGSNLKLNGNFVTTADDTITLACDGTNWFEIARSVN